MSDCTRKAGPPSFGFPGRSATNPNRWQTAGGFQPSDIDPLAAFPALPAPLSFHGNLPVGFLAFDQEQQQLCTSRGVPQPV